MPDEPLSSQRTRGWWAFSADGHPVSGPYEERAKAAEYVRMFFPGGYVELAELPYVR